jgi:hypothetical protein
VNAHAHAARLHGWRAASLDYLELRVRAGEADGLGWSEVPLALRDEGTATPTRPADINVAHAAYLRRTLCALVPSAIAVLPDAPGVGLEGLEGLQPVALTHPVVKHFTDTLCWTQSPKVLAVLAIATPRGHCDFLEYCIALARRNAPLNIASLFHGAKTAENVAAICRDGFDMRVASTGVSGRGTYFAKRSGYSTSGYASPVPSEARVRLGLPMDCKCVIVARVALGHVSGTTSDLRLTRPPDGYDCVASGESNVVLFDNRAAIPEFLICYSGS